MWNHAHRQNLKESENPRFYGQNKLFFLASFPLALGWF
jgi:hypothetical protein